MRILKKTFSMLLVVSMLFSMIPAVSAAEGPEISMGMAEVDISNGAASVTVPVKITNNPGFTGMDLSISIPEGWSISEIETRTATEYSIFYALNKYNEMEMQASAEVNVNKNGVGKFLLSSGSKSFVEDGYLFWVTYEVPAKIDSGNYAVEIDPVKINTLEDTTVNIAKDFTFTAGAVTVTGGNEPAPELSPEIKMGNAEVDLSEGAASVTVPVKITNNPGFTGMDLSISIPEGWSISEIETRTQTEYSIFYALNKYNEMEMQASAEVNVNKNGVGKFLLSSGSKSFAEDGYLFWVTYNVPADTEAGDYKVKVDPVKINTLEDTTVNIAENIEFTAGTVTVAKETVEETGDLLVKISGVEESDFITVYLYETYPGDYIDTTKIGGNGEWTFEGLAAGTYAIEAVCAGYETGFASAMVYVGDITDVNIEMTKKEAETYYVEGTILGVNTTDSITVCLLKDGDVIQQMEVKGGNTFRFEGLEPDNYGLDFSGEGYEDYYTTFYIEDKNVTGYNVELKKELPIGDTAEEKLAVADVVHTTYNGEDSEVTVKLNGLDTMTVYAIEGSWDLEEQEGSGYLTLTGMGSETLEFDDAYNYVEPSEGYVIWTDDLFKGLGSLEDGTNLLTATYMVDGNTPEGKYTVAFSTDVLTAKLPEDVKQKTYSGKVYTATITVEHHTHVYDQEVAADRYLATSATCTKAATYYKSCACDEGVYNDDTFSYGKPMGHAYVATSYNWAENGKSCTVTGVCANDAAHVKTVDATVTAKRTVEPTCEEKGETTYTATFDVEWAETQVKILADVSELGHDYHVVCSRCEKVDPDAELTEEKVKVAGEIAYTVEYATDSRTVVVNHTIACKVGYLKDDGTYEVITAEINADGSYGFDVPIDAGELLIVVKGDSNGDGTVNAADKMALAAALVRKTNAAYVPLTTEEQKFALDINGDGNVNAADKMALAAALVRKTNAAYVPLSWTE